MMKKVYWVLYILMALVYGGLFVSVMHSSNGQGDLGWCLLYGATFRPVCRGISIGVLELCGYPIREILEK